MFLRGLHKLHLSSHFPGDGGRDSHLSGNLFCEVS